MHTGLLISMRPEQWTKNLIVFAALIFGRRLFDPAAVGLSLAAFLIFCAVSGVVYLVNDVNDRETDLRHPAKRQRPIAAGELGSATALVMGRFIEPLLFNTSSRSPAAFVVAMTLIVVMAALASFVPAWRASRVDPVAALRGE